MFVESLLLLIQKKLSLHRLPFVDFRSHPSTFPARKMALPMTLHEDHQVLGEDYCSGYIDTFGKWSNGFPCPSIETEERVYCCGTDNFKYCCTKRDMHALTQDIPQLPLILGVVFGVAVAVIVVVVVSCFHCSCCLLYKKRQPSNGASGVANMYSFSATTTPSETPRSLSRMSGSFDETSASLSDYSVRSFASHATVESGSNTSNHFDHRTLIESDDPRPIVQSFANDRRHGNHRPGSVNMSDRSSSISDGGPTELPPPYAAPHSTLVAVRTSSAYALMPTPRPPSPTYGNHNSPYVISGGDSGYSTGPLATFPNTFMSPASPARPPPVRLPPSLPHTFAPALTPTTRPCSTAHIIHTHQQPLEELLYTATKF
ncbi:uncharacterized protein LOC135222863 isoform X2 [Macrobrachium nipponense]|uniref:uncharacterized protein LOC135222863 isoform X2 n=1 Tax=Macrobrachium nipponense TaxID=159736 RepID=UPI0030C803F6